MALSPHGPVAVAVAVAVVLAAADPAGVDTIGDLRRAGRGRAPAGRDA